MKIDAVNTKSKINMFIRKYLCVIKGHRFKTSTKYHCGGTFVEGKTYCNRCGIITNIKVIGGV